jgi:hypothetical protein
MAAVPLIHDERPNLADVGTERREFRAPDHGAVAFGDDEPLRMRLDVVKRARQQMADAEIRRNQSVNGGRIGRNARS